MEIRYSKYDEINDIMKIINDAKQYFTNKKIFQWNSSYPNYDTIKNDIDNSSSFIVLEDNKIIGTFAFIIGEDKSYNSINEGKWITDELYATIHRLAIDKNYKRKGIGNKIIKYCEKCCLQNNIKSLRIDTHQLNIPMKNLIEKNYFTYCGVINTQNNSKRIAYEKILK